MSHTIKKEKVVETSEELIEKEEEQENPPKQPQPEKKD